MTKVIDFDGDHGATYVDEIRKGIPGYEDLHILTAAFLLDQVADHGTILVVGCGGGEECLTLSGANPNWRLVGVDPSPQMIAIARKRTEGRAGMRLVQGDLATLPAAAPFDAATSLLVLHFIEGDEKKREHLARIADRLKPGGTLILAAVVSPTASPLNGALAKAWASYAVLKGANREAVEAKIAKIAEEIDPVDEGGMLRLLDEAGFAHSQRFYQGLRFSAFIAVKA